MEVEYVLPNMTYKCKSFLLPAGTLIGQKEMEEREVELVPDA